MITLAFMESKLAYSVGRIETLIKIFQHPVSENISGVSFDELLSKSLILYFSSINKMFTLFVPLYSTILSVSPEA